MFGRFVFGCCVVMEELRSKTLFTGHCVWAFCFGCCVVVDESFSRLLFPGHCVWSFGFSLQGLASRSPCSPLVAVDVYRCVRTVL